MEKIKPILKSIRPLRSIHFLLMFFLGAFLTYNLSIFSIWTMILGFISVFCAWQFDLIVNDIFDVEIDSITNKERVFTQDMVSRRTYTILGIIYIIIAIIISLFLSILTLLFIIGFMLMGYAYSVPPLRLRRFAFQTVFIGLGSFLCFHAGFFAHSNFIHYNELIISILIFIAFSLGTTVKDYKDYEGDKKDNVATIFTKFGMEKGIKICSVFLLITFLIPLLLIYHLIDFIIIIPMAVSTIILFNWKRNLKKVEVTFIVYFIEIAYVFLRYFGILIF